jgi:hypothetical protein
MTTSRIAERFEGGVRTGGDVLAPFMAGLDTAEGAVPTILVQGMDLTMVTRPRAMRAMVHQRMTQLQVELVRSPHIRQVLVVVLIDDVCDQNRVCARLEAAATSVHRRVEMLRGRPFALLAIALPRSAPPEHVRRRIAEAVSVASAGAAAVTWQEVETWGVRAATALQSL